MQENKKINLSTKEMIVFSILGTIMFLSKILMEWIPNIHLLGMFTVAFTVTYRSKALFPIYIMVFLNGILSGFALWWIPYLYIWTILWGVTMLLPKKMPNAVAIPVYTIVCAIHGLAYGTLYAPTQAILFGLSFKGMIAWIIAGFPWDILQCLGNFCAGFLIVPLCKLLKMLDSKNLHY